MKNTFGRAINGVGEPHRREGHIGRISTVGSGGKSISITNMNNSQLRDLVPITPYGISSSPPIGLMAFVLVANNSGRDGFIGVFDPNKPSCSPGDSMMYSSGGASVHCKGNSVLINATDVLKEIENLKTEMENLKKSIPDDSAISELKSKVEEIDAIVKELNK